MLIASMRRNLCTSNKICTESHLSSYPDQTIGEKLVFDESRARTNNPYATGRTRTYTRSQYTTDVSSAPMRASTCLDVNVQAP